MGMGFSGAYADKVSTEFVNTICPDELAELRRILQKYNLTFEAFARAFMWEEPDVELAFEHHETPLDDPQFDNPDFDWDDYYERAKTGIGTAWETLRKDFKTLTTVDGEGLDLLVVYHGEEDGDRYDNVQGAFFCVEGVYQLSPAGRKFKDQIERVHYVNFG